MKYIRILVSLLILFTCSVGNCAVNFDGSNDFISTADLPVESTPISYSAWINFTNLASDQRTILSKYDAQDTSFRSFLWRVETDGVIGFYTINAANTLESTKTANSVISINTWYHVGVRFDGTAGNDKVELFVDGVSVAISATDDDSVVMKNTTNSILIGKNKSANDPAIGPITEVAMWIGIELTDTEFFLLGKSLVKGMPYQIQPDNLVMYLPLDDYPHNDTANSANGLVFKDRSGNGNDGTASGCNAQAEEVLSYP